MTGGPFREGATGFRLRELALPARLLATLFLLTVSAGLAAAEWTVLATHAGADGNPGLSMEDLRRVYCGRPGWTLIASKVDGGSMAKHVPIPSERSALVDWAAQGATPAEFEPARRVLDLRCVKCHSPGGEKEDSPFADSREAGARHGLVAAYAKPDRGMSPAARGRTTHAHVFGFSVLFLLLGGLFLLTDLGPRAKAAAVALPFAGMALDVGSWWLALLSPAFLWTLVLGGALVGAGILVLVARPLWEMWGPRPREVGPGSN